MMYDAFAEINDYNWNIIKPNLEKFKYSTIIKSRRTTYIIVIRPKNNMYCTIGSFTYNPFSFWKDFQQKTVLYYMKKFLNNDINFAILNMRNEIPFVARMSELLVRGIPLKIKSYQSIYHYIQQRGPDELPIKKKGDWNG